MMHTCHAYGCDVPVPPRLFMCKRHWFALPKEHRDAIWCHYKPGQEITKMPSAGYLRAAGAAIQWLKDNPPPAPAQASLPVSQPAKGRARGR